MMNVTNVGRTLAEVSRTLAQLTGDRMTRQVLEANAVHLQLGAVRLMLLGSSGAGKSTMINALLRCIAVPESGLTSSPIPVWFTPGEGLTYKVYRDGPNGPELMEQPGRDQFIRKYCFNVSDILDDKRSRFEEVGWASAELDSALLRETGATLIDTLGIGVTDADTIKTLKVIDSGVDLVVFVTADHVQLQQDDITFLREKVLGLGERKVPYPISPSQLLLVYNDHGAGGTYTQMQSAVDKLLKGLEEEEIQRFKENNLVMVNALAARLGRCGAYDYHHFAPEGTPEMLTASLIKQTERDRQALTERAEQIAEQTAVFQQLEDKVRRMAYEQMHGTDGVVMRRIIRLERIMKEIRAQAGAELGRLKGDRAAIQHRIADIRQLLQTFTEANREVDAVYDEQRMQMQAAVVSTLSNSQSARDAIVGKIYELEQPPEFINKESMERFFDSSSLEREKLVEEWIRTIMEESFLPEASRRFKTTLLETTAQEGDPGYTQQDTVSWQLAAARKLTMQQGVRMKNFCDQLRLKGAADIGMSVPDEETIEQWAADMASAMETSILASVADLQEVAYRKLSEQLPGIVRTILGKGLLQVLNTWWTRLMGNVNKFWLAVRNSAVKDAAKAISNEWFSASLGNAGNDMFFGIDKAYAQMQKNVFYSLERQCRQVEDYLDQLEKALENTSDDESEASEALRNTEEALEAQKAKLDELRSHIG